MFETKDVFFKVEMWKADSAVMELLQHLEDAIEYARMIEDHSDFVEVSGPYAREELNDV